MSDYIPPALSMSVVTSHGLYSSTLEEYRATERQHAHDNLNDLLVILWETDPEVDWTDIRSRGEALVIISEWRGAMYVEQMQRDYEEIMRLLNL